MLVRDKHFSLLDPFVSYAKMDYCDAPWPYSQIRLALKGFQRTNTLAYFVRDE